MEETPNGQVGQATAPVEETTTPTETKMTYGQKAVGIFFNVGGDENVALVKQTYANIIDLLNDLRIAAGPSEAARLFSVAITEAQAAQMWAVKAITWKEEPKA